MTNKTQYLHRAAIEYDDPELMRNLKFLTLQYKKRNVRELVLDALAKVYPEISSIVIEELKYEKSDRRKKLTGETN